jgi:hypothetical protein
MIPVIQTKVVVRNSKGDIVVSGNCYAAAIASMLDLPITEVPNCEVFFPWSEENRFWDQWMNAWLELKGWKIESAPEYGVYHDDEHYADGTAELLKDDFYFVSGPSVRGVNHICIFKAGRLVHDPHPTKEGILECKWFEKLTKIQSNGNS